MHITNEKETHASAKGKETKISEINFAASHAMHHHTSLQRALVDLVVTISLDKRSDKMRRIVKLKPGTRPTAGIQKRRCTGARNGRKRIGTTSCSFPQFSPRSLLKNLEVDNEYGSMTHFSNEVVKRCGLLEDLTSNISNPAIEATEEAKPISTLMETESASAAWRDSSSEGSFSSLSSFSPTPLFSVSLDLGYGIEDQYGSLAPVF